MKKLEKTYHLFFYKLLTAVYWLDEVCSRPFNFRVDLWWCLFKTAFLLSFFQFLIFMSGITIMEIITKSAINIETDGFVLGIGFGFLIINVITFLVKNRWKKYIKEFKNYSLRKNRIINIVVSILFLLTPIISVLLLKLYGHLYRSDYFIIYYF